MKANQIGSGGDRTNMFSSPTLSRERNAIAFFLGIRLCQPFETVTRRQILRVDQAKLFRSYLSKAWAVVLDNRIGQNEDGSYDFDALVAHVPQHYLLMTWEEHAGYFKWLGCPTSIPVELHFSVFAPTQRSDLRALSECSFPWHLLPSSP